MTTAKNLGFTLIELMITVAVVAILAAIAIPTYSSYVQRANRQDATRSLTSTAQALERCYSQNFVYAPGCNTVAGAAPSSGGYYTITTTITPAAGNIAANYTLTAIAVKAPQLTDSTCATFTLDSTGKQSAQNTALAATTQACWGST